MNTLLNKFIESVRQLVVLVTVAALALCGATAAERQAALIAAQQIHQAGTSPTADLLEPSPDEAPGGEMAPGKSLNVEPSGWLVPLGVHKTGNDDPRTASASTITSGVRTPEAARPRLPAIATSSHQISSSLGRQFTLVGAKPSGTS